MKESVRTDDLVCFYKALASRSRLVILSLLAGRPLCVNALARSIGISQSAVSQHLEVLKGAGLVLGERSGTMVHYRLDRDRLKRLEGLAALLLRQSQDVVQPSRKDVLVVAAHGGRDRLV